MKFKKRFSGVTMLAILALSACRSPQEATTVQTASPFSFTSVALDNGSHAWILQNTNGLSLEMQQQKLTINFTIDNTITAWFDPRTKRLVKILLETPNTASQPGQWVTDFNADGIPDARRVKGKDGNQVFYNGQWYPSEPMGGTNTAITIEGNKTLLFFDGVKWTKASESN